MFNGGGDPYTEHNITLRELGTKYIKYINLTLRNILKQIHKFQTVLA